MGSVSLKIGDGTARFRATTIYSTILNAIMLFSLLLTNLLALYTFSFPANQTPSLSTAHHQKNFSLISHEVSLILSEINSSQHKLAQMQKELIGFETLDLSVPGLPSELKLYMEAQPLPLGKDSRMGITEMVSAVGHACVNSIDLLSLYMNYKPGHQCPDDWDLAQKLMLRGCEPLPRRRCFSRSIPKLGLFPSLKSLWKMVPESSISWSRFACKNFDCLKKTLKDCPNCFDLNAEKKMWADAKDRFEFPIDEVIALGKGSLKLGPRFGFWFRWICC
ncbi:uncharacterized protein LOC18430443 [Amborella trichopoda]|uniref:Uncharacterized protein n=1 Tax=Amborella trichopoda TaxID=13333 RepID=W1P340_AMBTC|nr:uncharacterized protein LOC18430443 [Amborella trichopoda]ERN02328.1 hypothetical protein AMTR_s00211p00024510 [Amborella trichopoda]|eukprot:XP_006840653.1 uncharacterized protein LOC18430443 [Amborella trichopoda]